MKLTSANTSENTPAKATAPRCRKAVSVTDAQQPDKQQTQPVQADIASSFENFNGVTTQPKTFSAGAMSAQPDFPDNTNLNNQMLRQLAQSVSEMSAQMRRMELKIDSVLPSSKLPEGMVSTQAAMRLLGYKDTHSFLVAARKRRVFYVRVNARKFCWSPAAIENWKRERGIGRPVEA